MSITVPSLLPPSNLGRLHEMVWSIPNIRSEIMLYLPNRDIISLLTTSKIHFHSAVEKLYEVFPYKEYENILTRCKDKTRKQAYWNAVRTIKLNRTLPPTKWVRYFGPFPNATCIQAPPMYVSTNPAMIFRTNEQGHYRFVFQPEESFKGEWQLTQGSVIPERIIGTPSAWGYRQPLTIMLSHPPSTLSPKNESNIMTNLLKINESPEYFVRSLELHVEVDRPAIFQALQQLHSTDKLRLQCLKVSDFNAETVNFIHISASTVEELLICCNRNTSRTVSLRQILDALDWPRFTKLRSLHISCHQGKGELQDAPLSTFLHGLALPGQALRSLTIDLHNVRCSEESTISQDDTIKVVKDAATTLLSFFKNDSSTYWCIRPICPTYCPRDHIMGAKLNQLFSKELERHIRECEARERRFTELI